MAIYFVSAVYTRVTCLNCKKSFRIPKAAHVTKLGFLIGVENWSVELKKSEFDSLCLSLLKINQQLLGIKDQLMDEESITLELEQLPWYILLEGKKNESHLLTLLEIVTFY